MGAAAIAPYLPSRHSHRYDDPWTFAENVQFSVVMAVFLFALLIWAIRAGRLRIEDGNIGIGIPARWKLRQWTTFRRAEIVRFEVRRWTWLRRQAWNVFEPRGGRYALSLLLTDGSWVQLLPFARAPSAGGDRRHLRESRGRCRRTAPLLDGEGRAVIWTVDNDVEIEHVFNDMLGVTPESGDARGSAPRVEDSYRLAFDVHRRHRRPARTTEREWLSEPLHGRTDPPIVPPPTLHPPVRATAPKRPSAASLWDEPAGLALPERARELKLPTRYWTLASQRTGSIAGGPPSMTIDAAGVTFARRLRRDLHVPLDDADRFDIAFDGIDPRDPYDEDERVIHGNWRLLLFRSDGTTVPLSGLDHGYFKENQLFWSTSTTSGRKLPAPKGSMPWPNDQPLEVAARLNAHLDVARRLGGAATTSAGAPAR